MTSIAWAAKVSALFLSRVEWIVNDLGIGANTADGMSNLMACMAWESGRSFSASVLNKAGSGAVGLIQFMPSTAKALGTTTAALAAMKAEDQLNYVWKYFENNRGTLKTLSDLYMAILWPAAIGKPETYALWDAKSKPTTYRQNAGLDTSKDGMIIKAEASAKLTAILIEGMRDGKAGEYKLDTDAHTAHGLLADPVGLAAELVEVKHRLNVALGDNSGNLPSLRNHEGMGTAISEPLTKVGETVGAAADTVAAIGRTVTVTADTITTVATEPNTTATVIKKAISGWQGNVAGSLAIVSALMLDPAFSSALGGFTTALASGKGGLGAIVALAGAALVVYRHKAGAGL